MREVRRHGVRHGIPQLIEPCWSADECDGWEMTSIAGFLLKAEGGYRTPSEYGFTYMILTHMTDAGSVTQGE